MVDRSPQPPVQADKPQDLPTLETRRTRLLALLPDIYARQPSSSAVGALIDAMATQLARFDADARKVMRDHWITTATGSANGGDVRGTGTGQSPLEELAVWLALPRLSGETADAYRRRLRIAIPIVLLGSGSPRAALDMTIAALGAEPCSREERSGNRTTRWGVPLGTAEACPVCRGEGGASSVGCPKTAERLVAVTLTDHPEKPHSIILTGIGSGTDFQAQSYDGAEHSPAITISVVLGPLRYAALRNTATHEMVVYDGDLNISDQLILRPGETPFAKHVAAGGVQSDVTSRMISAIEYIFGDSRNPSPTDPRLTSRTDSDVAPIRFTDVRKSEDSPTMVLQVPTLRPQPDPWHFGLLDETQMQNLRKGKLSPAKARLRPGASGSAAVAAGSADLTFTWYSAQSACFSVGIENNAWVQKVLQDEERKTLVRDSVKRVRAAGVTALVENAVFAAPSK